MKILIVEDDKTCANIFKTRLSKYGQCSVVYNGEDAIKKYTESLTLNSPFQLMILDIVLPNGISGGEVLKLVRQIEQENNIPEMDKLRIIVTTAFDDWYNRKIIIKNLDCLYENYYLKSANIDELVDKIQDLGFVLD